MNPIPEPDELQEAECNAQGLYGLPHEAFQASKPGRQGPAPKGAAGTVARVEDGAEDSRED